MAVYRGITGSVISGALAGTKIANIKSWTLTSDVGNNDTSAFGDKDATSVFGLRNSTAQISGDLSTDANQGALMAMVGNTGTLASVRLHLVVSTEATRAAKFWAGAANLTNLQIGSELAGVSSFSASFHLSGGVKYPTS